MAVVTVIALLSSKSIAVVPTMPSKVLTSFSKSLTELTVEARIAEIVPSRGVSPIAPVKLLSPIERLVAPINFNKLGKLFPKSVSKSLIWLLEPNIGPLPDT